MTMLDLNIQTKELWDEHRSHQAYPMPEEARLIQEKLATLIHTDNGFDKFTHTNLKRIFVLNRKYRAVPQTWFGVHVKEDELD